MSVPRLNRALVLESPERTPDGAGGFAQTWVGLGTLWADVTPGTGAEQLVGEAPTSRVSHRIVVRGAPHGALSRPRPEQRFREGARVFQIRAVTERDPQGQYLTCFADEEIVA